MERRAVCALLVALLLVIVGPSHASAECAWVLWGRPNGGQVYERSPEDKGLIPAEGWWAMGVPPEPWIVRAFPTHEACEAVLRSEYTVKPGHEILKSVASTRLGERREQFIPSSYICLPDSIDPRGPKR
jgi:hypothetical protein